MISRGYLPQTAFPTIPVLEPPELAVSMLLNCNFGRVNAVKPVKRGANSKTTVVGLWFSDEGQPRVAAQPVILHRPKRWTPRQVRRITH